MSEGGSSARRRCFACSGSSRTLCFPLNTALRKWTRRWSSCSPALRCCSSWYLPCYRPSLLQSLSHSNRPGQSPSLCSWVYCPCAACTFCLLHIRSVKFSDSEKLYPGSLRCWRVTAGSTILCRRGWRSWEVLGFCCSVTGFAGGTVWVWGFFRHRESWFRRRKCRIVQRWVTLKDQRVQLHRQVSW